MPEPWWVAQCSIQLSKQHHESREGRQSETLQADVDRSSKQSANNMEDDNAKKTALERIQKLLVYERTTNLPILEKFLASS